AVYPNPTSGLFNIALNGYADQTFELTVVNAIGQIVYTTSLNVNAESFVQSIDLTEVVAGVYQIALVNNGTTINYSISIID
ncbi:MAG: T9SS type A sorting domain-containing protein, partial [Chitinophagales bacterium]